MDGKQMAQSIMDDEGEVIDKQTFDSQFSREITEAKQENKQYRLEEKPMDVSYETQIKCVEKLIAKSDDKQRKYLEAILHTIKAQREACDLARSVYDVFYAYRNKTQRR